MQSFTNGYIFCSQTARSMINLENGKKMIKQQFLDVLYCHGDGLLSIIGEIFNEGAIVEVSRQYSTERLIAEDRCRLLLLLTDEIKKICAFFRICR